ncbi:MAG TPA: class I SAM-dependent methyltransferase [Bryobacteraceae bacterium]|jgi:SAM-dependent methyltransferase
MSEWSTTRGEKWVAQLANMEAMLAPVDQPLIEALNIQEPSRIADVGCGGGPTSIAILRSTPIGSVVHGYDLATASIEAARKRESGVEFRVADMAAAEPPAQLYDRLVSRFGVMFFEDPSQAFSNLQRWLAPGGRFAFAVWGPQEENPWRTNISDAVGQVIELPPFDPEAPGPFRYADADKFLGVLESSGFTNLAVKDWRGPLAIGGGLPAAQAADFAIASISSFLERLTEAGEDALATARKTLTGRFSNHLQDGVVKINATVHIVTGSR